MKTLPFRTKFVAAHRGSVTAGVQENTIESFEAAIQGGADVLELDVRRLADGELVVYHDAAIGDRRVGELTRDELEHLVRDRRVPPLASVADALIGRVQLDVELKDRGIEADAIDVLLRAGWSPSDFALTSFDISMLVEARRVRPDLVVGVLTEDQDLTRAVAHVVAVDGNFLAPHESTLDAAALDRCREAEIPVVPWTVNDPARLRTLLACDGVAGIITDTLTLALDIRRAIERGRAAPVARPSSDRSSAAGC